MPGCGMMRCLCRIPQDVAAAGADEEAMTVEEKLMADAERLAASIQVWAGRLVLAPQIRAWQ